MAVLQYYNNCLETCLETNLLDSVIGGMLSQLHNNRFWHPVIFYLCTMLPAKLNYTIYNKELLAIVACIKEWYCELKGLQSALPIQIYLDYKVLKYFITKY